VLTVKCIVGNCDSQHGHSQGVENILMGCTEVSKETCYFSVFCLLRGIADDSLQLLAMHVLLAVEALLLTPKACLMVLNNCSS